MFDPISEQLARLVVDAVTEIRECVASGEHPKAAEIAVRLAYSDISATWDDTRVLASALAKCEKASRVYTCAPDAAAGLLEAAAERLADLEVRAKELLAREECFC